MSPIYGYKPGTAASSNVTSVTIGAGGGGGVIASTGMSISSAQTYSTNWVITGSSIIINSNGVFETEEERLERLERENGELIAQAATLEEQIKGLKKIIEG